MACLAGPVTRPANALEAKKLITHLSIIEADEPTLVSLVIPPKAKIAQTLKMLMGELDILRRARTSRNAAMIDALEQTVDTLGTFPAIPPNGLVVFVGGADRIALEPSRPVQFSLYACDTTFHPEALCELRTFTPAT
jgi:peptide chain release factor subunit 1